MRYHETREQKEERQRNEAAHAENHRNMILDGMIAAQELRQQCAATGETYHEAMRRQQQQNMGKRLAQRLADRAIDQKRLRG